MPLKIGTTLGPYRIVGQLGRGGMGVVYRATDPRLKRTVAIKLLPPDLTRDETAKQRFLQEAQAASALDHRNICTIYEINKTDEGQLYLVMAHYEGETLKERIARGPLDLNDAIDIATQVGQGLAEAHGAGIVHRDIKPANLMVTTDGTVKILDFGVAKLVGTGGVTQTATTAGTVAYMSPEQARGEELDPRTDLFSLGSVLYEMVTGRQAFPGKTIAIVFDALLNRAPIASVRLRPDTPATLQDVINGALKKDRTLRYQTAVDIQADLQRTTRDINSGVFADVSDATGPTPTSPGTGVSDARSDPEWASATRISRESDAGGSSAVSGRKRVVTAVLCLLLGVFGVHRFYVGKTLSGIAQLVTVGGLGIWMLADLLLILFGEFVDADGKTLKTWI